MSPVLPVLVTVLGLTAVAAVLDARTGRIPNWLTFPALLLAPLVHLVLGGPWALAGSLAGLVACALLPVLLFHKGALGGGDVKLFAALGAIAGTEAGFKMQLAAFIAGAAIAVVRLAMHRGLGATLKRSGRILRGGHVEPAETVEMRFGPAILVGTTVVCLLGYAG